MVNSVSDGFKALATSMVSKPTPQGNLTPGVQQGGGEEAGEMGETAAQEAMESSGKGGKVNVSA